MYGFNFILIDCVQIHIYQQLLGYLDMFHSLYTAYESTLSVLNPEYECMSI